MTQLIADPELFSGADEDRVIHCLVEGIRAVRIGIARRIIRMRTVIDHAAVIGKRDACRRCQKQAVAERYIGGNRLAVGLFQLLGVAFLRDLAAIALEQGAA